MRSQDARRRVAFMRVHHTAFAHRAEFSARVILTDSVVNGRRSRENKGSNLSDPSVDEIVDYALALRYQDLSENVLHQATRRVVDTLACALGAYGALPVHIACEMAVPVQGPFTARLIGRLRRTTTELAAFANGVMSRYLDFNDSSLGGNRGGHPSDNLSGVLALAETTQASGKDFLLALTICYEIQCRIADSVPFQDKGWDQPVAGVIGVAAACGRLLKLSAAQIRQAISIAVVSNYCSYQTRIGEISMWKGCASANGTKQGLFAAILASKGMTGPAQPISGIHGLYALTVGRPYAIAPFTRNGENFAIALSALKKHPVRTFGQLMVDAAMDLARKINASEIASLRIRTFAASYKHKEIEDPQTWSATTRETADHSLLFAIAATLLDGRLTPQSYEQARYLDQDVVELIRRFRVEIDDVFDQEFKSGIRNCALEATSKTGSAYASHLRSTPEDIARGPSDTEIEGKFESLTEQILSPAQRRSLLDGLWNLDAVSDVASIVDRTAVSKI